MNKVVRDMSRISKKFKLPSNSGAKEYPNQSWVFLLLHDHQNQENHQRSSEGRTGKLMTEIGGPHSWIIYDKLKALKSKDVKWINYFNKEKFLSPRLSSLKHFPWKQKHQLVYSYDKRGHTKRRTGIVNFRH